MGIPVVMPVAKDWINLPPSVIKIGTMVVKKVAIAVGRLCRIVPIIGIKF